MRLVINVEYGGFSLSEEMATELNVYCYNSSLEVRTDPRLIEAVLNDSTYASGRHAELKVVEIPDEATDWTIEEYDGFEYIIYVLDGKLHTLEEML